MPLGGFQGMPDKSPSDFLPSVLRRLMPSAAELAGLDRDALLTLKQKQTDLTKIIRSDPARFATPNEGGQWNFCTCADPIKRVFLYIAGNKSGKTWAGAIRHLELRFGGPLWGRATRTATYPTPTNGVIFAEDFDSHKEVTLPTILTWAPAGFFQSWDKNSAGQVTAIHWSNGAITYFRTYDQGAEKAEGKDWHDAWCDEPPPRDLYTAVFRGLVVNDGKMFITATLLKEAWLFDEAEDHPHVATFEGTIHDNPHLHAQAKADFLATLDDDERQVRETGRPKALVGLVYKNFLAAAPFIVEDAPLHDHYPIIMGVDPHERKPIFVMYGFVDPEDRITWFRYVLVPSGSEKAIFEKLKAVEEEMPTAPVVCYMDPNRGAARQKDGTCWQDSFEGAGYYVELPIDDLKFGHTAVRNYLDPAAPTMFFTQACLGKGGPVHALTRYAWEDVNKRRDLDLKEKPKDRYKDWPDIIRYTAVSRPTFAGLTEGARIVQRLPETYLTRRIRAYS